MGTGKRNRDWKTREMTEQMVEQIWLERNYGQAYILTKTKMVV